MPASLGSRRGRESSLGEASTGDAHGIEGVDVENVEAAAFVHQHLGEALLEDDGVDDKRVVTRSGDVGRMVSLIESDQGVKALVLFWLIDETLSANLVYQDDYEIDSTTPSNEAMTKIMTMVMALLSSKA